jgi:hypothetical protein
MKPDRLLEPFDDDKGHGLAVREQGLKAWVGPIRAGGNRKNSLTEAGSL